MKFIVHITLEIEAESIKEVAKKIKEILPKDTDIQIAVLDEEMIHKMTHSQN